jgi:hypothetical protein
MEKSEAAERGARSSSVAVSGVSRPLFGARLVSADKPGVDDDVARVRQGQLVNLDRYRRCVRHVARPTY